MVKIIFDAHFVFTWVESFRKVHSQLCSILLGLGQPTSHMWLGPSHLGLGHLGQFHLGQSHLGQKWYYGHYKSMPAKKQPKMDEYNEIYLS